MATEAQKRATKKYDAANTRQIHLKLNKNTDADIIAHLEKQESIQGYIKDLIDLDMENVTIIRCKGCKFYLGNGYCNMSGIHLEVNDEWFCAGAEPKTTE